MADHHGEQADHQGDHHQFHHSRRCRGSHEHEVRGRHQSTEESGTKNHCADCETAKGMGLLVEAQNRCSSMPGPAAPAPGAEGSASVPPPAIGRIATTTATAASTDPKTSKTQLFIDLPTLPDGSRPG